MRRRSSMMCSVSGSDGLVARYQCDFTDSRLFLITHAQRFSVLVSFFVIFQFPVSCWCCRLNSAGYPSAFERTLNILID